MNISEKDKKIVAAINHFKCDTYNDKVFAELIKNEPDYPNEKVGGKFFVNADFDTNRYSLLCTLEEYQKGIENMARARWMSNGDSYSTYKYNCNVSNIDTSNKTLLKEHCIYDKPLVYTQHQDVFISGYEGYAWKFGCYLLDGNNCIVLNGYGSHMTIPVSRLRVKPILTPEQIKQTIKDEQLKEYTNIIRDACLPVTDKKVKVMLEFLQDKNLLADPFAKLKGGEDE